MKSRMRPMAKEEGNDARISMVLKMKPKDEANARNELKKTPLMAGTRPMMPGACYIIISNTKDGTMMPGRSRGSRR